jgi:TetR/AcrR family transcriptional regulator, ethionamide resistance regulator
VLEPLLETARYAELSVEQVIAAGGIARSTFYGYFTDKGELLCAMADEVLDDVFAAGVNWWDFPDEGGLGDLRAALMPAIQTHLRHGLILAAVAENAGTDERVRTRQARLIDGLSHDLAGHISDAQQAGSACPDVDPERTAKWLMWTFDRALYELVTPAEPAETDRLLDAVTLIIWRTLYAGHRAM